MRIRIAGDVSQRRLYLQNHGIIVPPTYAAIANLANYIQQRDVVRNKVPPARRIAEVRAVQAKWIEKKVRENDSGKTGVVRYLILRRPLANCFGTITRNKNVFLAVVDWDNGGCHRGMTINQLSLVDTNKKTRAKASA